MPIDATYILATNTFLIHFSQQLQFGTMNAGAFQFVIAEFSDTRLGSGVATIGGNQVQGTAIPIGPTPGPVGLKFNNIAHELYGVNGLEVQSFAGFPVTYV